MSLLFWASLGLLLVATAGAVALVVVRTIELVRTVRASGRVIAAGADRILNATAALEQRAGGVGSDQRLSRRVAELEVSVARLRVLLRELGRIRATVGAVRGVVPRK